MAKIELRPYQLKAVDETFRLWGDAGERDALVVAPCGAGKSLIIAETIRRALEWDGVRVLVLTHRAELLQQNGGELRAILPGADIGFFSASLGKKEKHRRVTFAGIASIARQIYDFEPWQVVIIDEAHLAGTKNSNAQYAKVIKAITQLNPNARFLHLTATPYRLDTGMLDLPVAHEIGVQFLIDEGHLLPLVSKRGAAAGRADLSGVKMRGGEFIAGEMERAFDQSELIAAAVSEVIELGADRRAWMVFASGVQHAEDIAAEFAARGVVCEVITGETPKDLRAAIIADFKAGNIKCLVNCDVLTIGFNAPICALIAMMRATCSAALYVQIAGRGQRLYPGKKDCLFLDYGGNVERLGFVDDPIIKLPGKGGGNAPVKVCKNCDTICQAGCRHCQECGAPFPDPEISHDAQSYAGAILKRQAEEAIWREVADWRWSIHRKPGKPDSVRVSYYIGGMLGDVVCEFLCPEHGGFAAKKAADAMRQFMPPDYYRPEGYATAAEIDAQYIIARMPARILVKHQANSKFYEVVRREYHEKT